MKREKAPKVENLNQVSVGVNEMLSIIAETNRLTLVLKLNLEILSFQLQVPNNNCLVPGPWDQKFPILWVLHMGHPVLMLSQNNALLWLYVP